MPPKACIVTSHRILYSTYYWTLSYILPLPHPALAGLGIVVVLKYFIQRITKCLKFQAERQKAFHIFLKQFLVIYKNWEPFGIDNSSEAVSSSVSYGDETQNPDEVVIGCSAAHPAEIIVVLIEEVTHITSMVTECKLCFYILNLHGDILLLLWIEV